MSYLPRIGGAAGVAAALTIGSFVHCSAASDRSTSGGADAQQQAACEPELLTAGSVDCGETVQYELAVPTAASHVLVRVTSKEDLPHPPVLMAGTGETECRMEGTSAIWPLSCFSEENTLQITTTDGCQTPLHWSEIEVRYTGAECIAVATEPKEEAFDRNVIADVNTLPAALTLSSPFDEGFRVTQGFGGATSHQRLNEDGLDLHYALDLVPLNRRGHIRPVADGRVVWTGWPEGSFWPAGYSVIIQHDVTASVGNDGMGGTCHRYYSVYSHLYRWYFDIGDDVTPSDTIGEMGSTGNAKGAHLHLGIYCDQEEEKELRAYRELQFMPIVKPEPLAGCSGMKAEYRCLQS